MSHRVAELMHEAENLEGKNREAAKRECADLIMRLWERRIDWPYGAPLTYILPALRRIVSEPDSASSWHQNAKKPDGTWSGLGSEIERLAERERQVLCAARFADISKEAVLYTKNWLEEFGNDLSNEELEAFELCFKWTDAVSGETFHLDGEAIPNFGNLPPIERNIHIQKALGRIAADKLAIIEATTSHDEALKIIEPRPMHGQIAPNEEKHGDIVAQMYEKMRLIYGEDFDDEDDEEVEEE